MQPNPIILSSPIILLLGAGASAPLDKLLMDSFVKKLTAKIRDGDQKTMLSRLIEFRGSDLEAIMWELETFNAMNYMHSVDGYRNSKVLVSGESTPTRFSLKRSTAQLLWWAIKHEIIRQYRNVDASKTVEIYEPLFDCLFSKIESSKQCLVVFTTNYDPAVEEFCRQKYSAYSLCDGFAYDPADRHNYWHRSVFDTFELDKDKRNIVLFKIHGSVDWIHVKATDKIRRGQAMYAATDADAYSNVLIYPATRKIATDDPYYSGYEYYQRCCESAKVCIAIGYSFRDYDALTRLRGASSVNENMKLALVSPNATEILKDVPVANGKKMALPYHFGQPDLVSQYVTKVEEILSGT